MAEKLTPAAKQKLKKALFEAVQNDEVAVVRRLIKQGADPDTIDRSDGYTPLNLAIEKRHLAIARVLLKAGAAPVNGVVDNLVEAIEDKNVELVKLLLSHGADPNGGASKQMRITRPLMEAARVGSMRIVDVLLAANADRTLQNEILQTAADIATESGFPRIAAKLRQPEHKRSKRKKPLGKENARSLKLAIERGSVDVVRKIAEGKDLDCYVEEMNTSPLVYAVWEGKVDVIRVFFDLGASLSYRTGEFPLEAAARGGRLDVMDLLVRLGAEVNQRAPSGATALTSAIKMEEAPAVKWLLDHNADPHGKDPIGRTAWDIMLEWEARVGKSNRCRSVLPLTRK